MISSQQDCRFNLLLNQSKSIWQILWDHITRLLFYQSYMLQRYPNWASNLKYLQTIVKHSGASNKLHTIHTGSDPNSKIIDHYGCSGWCHSLVWDGPHWTAFVRLSSLANRGVVGSEVWFYALARKESPKVDIMVKSWSRSSQLSSLSPFRLRPPCLQVAAQH